MHRHGSFTESCEIGLVDGYACLLEELDEPSVLFVGKLMGCLGCGLSGCNYSGLQAIRKCVECTAIHRQSNRRVNMVGERDILLHFVEGEFLDDGHRIFLSIQGSLTQRNVDIAKRHGGWRSAQGGKGGNS